MAEVFISYGRSTEAQAHRIGEALRALGYGVWRDDELPAHRAYADVIEERLKAAKAVVVVWSAEATRSHWVRAEAERAREEAKIVQVRVDGARLPMPFDQIQCADLTGWSGETTHPGWRKTLESVADLTGEAAAPAPRASEPGPAAPSLPDEPSIAVLPFADPSGAVEGDYFADGMVEEIVNALTRHSTLFVIASRSSLSYRERERDFRKIGRELGVRYLLEGSVRRSGPRVRIGADLVEAEAGARIWSERFEGTLEDIFALQDEVANAVAARIEPAIQAADLRRGAARPTEDLGAYDLFLRAQQQYRVFDKAGYLASVVLAGQAVARDPTFATAWGLVAALHATLQLYGWTDDPQRTVRQGREAIRRAVQANADDALALAQVAFAISVLGGDRGSSLPMADRALALNPGSFLCSAFAGHASLGCGEFEQALERYRHALRLNPRAPDRSIELGGIGTALVGLQRFEEAIPWLKEAMALSPDFPSAPLGLALALSSLGRIEEGKAALARFEELASLKGWLDTLQTGSEFILPALRRLGAAV
ncbi:MAG TPA: TIR domain-containing protein [Caulobacteraceae bacterium]|nr:TIR domain-containing protein [Caulobacteraceae bacterium]